MKQGWEIKKLGEVLSLEYGKPLPKEKRIHEGLYPVYGANGIINRTNEYYVDEPSIIVGRKGSAGEINYTEEKFWPLDVTYYTKFDENELNLNFLYYLLTLLELPKLAKGVKPGINRNDVYAIKTLIPTISEQKRIVAKLDQCFEAIDKAKANVERNLQNAKELFQSQLNQIFSQKGDGWVEKKLGELGTLTSSKRIFKKEYVSMGVPFYRSKEIKELAHNKDISQELFITKERYKEIKSQFGVPKKGDILLTAVGTIGEMYVVRENDEFYFKDGNIMWLKDFPSLNAYYLKYALASFVEQIKALSQGSAYNALTIEKLKKYSVPVPPVFKQKEIVLQLDKIHYHTQSLESHYQQELDALDELKISILQKAFNGEL